MHTEFSQHARLEPVNFPTARSTASCATRTDGPVLRTYVRAFERKRKRERERVRNGEGGTREKEGRRELNIDAGEFARTCFRAASPPRRSLTSLAAVHGVSEWRCRKQELYSLDLPTSLSLPPSLLPRERNARALRVRGCDRSRDCLQRVAGTRG